MELHSIYKRKKHQTPDTLLFKNNIKYFPNITALMPNTFITQTISILTMQLPTYNTLHTTTQKRSTKCLGTRLIFRDLLAFWRNLQLQNVRQRNGSWKWGEQTAGGQDNWYDLIFVIFPHLPPLSKPPSSVIYLGNQPLILHWGRERGEGNNTPAQSVELWVKILTSCL